MAQLMTLRAKVRRELGGARSAPEVASELVGTTHQFTKQ